MNKIVSILVLASGLLLSCNSSSIQSDSFVEYTSVSAFFQLADKLSLGTEPTEEEWAVLFETQGYKKCIAETFEERGVFTRQAMELAFNPAKVAEKDSVLSIPVVDIVSDWEALLLRVMLENYMDIRKHQSAMKEYIHTMKSGELMLKSCQRLADFLINPVDSLISPIPVSLVCMEPDALSLSGRIVWDCNAFYKHSEEEKVDVMAHEMFHAYRKHFAKSKANDLIGLIDSWLNEGVADLIDKKSVSDLSLAFVRYGFPESYVEAYNEVYQSTPQTLKELEELTLSFIHNKIEEKEYKSKLSDFEQYGGHPNGYYMTTTIKEAGYEKELIGSFYSPIEFMKLYNKSVAKEYVLGNEFMDYIESLK